MNKHFNFGISILVSLAAVGCSTDIPGPETTGPDPVYVVKFLGRDSIAEGSYRGISINSPADDAFMVLEDYRKDKTVAYLGAVNNFFSDVTDLENRIPLFDWIVLDEKFDTDSGVQMELASGIVKSITLNNRKELKQWPEAADPKAAIQIGDQPQVLYNKLVALSKQTEFSRKFEKIMLSTKHTYALYDPYKASQPWTFIYFPQSQSVSEQVAIYFKDKKVHYIIVDRFEKQ